MAKYIIVGGVAGGATAAARLRRLDESAEIIIYERGEYISYANCGLPYHIGQTIRSRDRLFLQTPESFYARLHVEVKILHEVVAIDPAKREVTVKNLRDGSTFTDIYDKLVLSPGAEPVRPNLPGINSPMVFTLRNVPDMDAILRHITTHNPQRVVIVGAGFIGLEMAENLHQRGIFVTIVEMLDQVMAPIDYEMAAEVHQHLKTKGVEFFLNEAVSSFKPEGDKLICCLKSGRCLPTDMVILSIGVRPDRKLAEAAGLKIGETGGIWVDEFLRTTDKNIYAVGDAVEFPHPIIKKPVCPYLAGPANRQGRIAADNIVDGDHRPYLGSIATAIAKVFDITVAATGVSEKVLKRENIPYLASVTHGASHAGYYPDALPLTIKLLFAPENGRVLGAQIVGFDGVDKRIDLIATIVKQGGTVYDLQEIEHAYAPPFSSAKDPVHIAGYVAENILRGRMKSIHWNEIEQLDLQKNQLLDVRTKEEFALGTIEGAINIPVDDLRDRLGELPKDRRLIVFCGVGLRGYFACRILMQKGFDAVNLSGGYKTWEHAISKQSNIDLFADSKIMKDNAIVQRPVAPGAPVVKIPVQMIEVDACGLQCPGPILRLRKEMEGLAPGQQLRITASDAGFVKDAGAWCQMTGNRLIEMKSEKGHYTAIIEKGGAEEAPDAGTAIPSGRRNKTLVVFSDDLDRALASLVIANGAASTGQKVTMFFTFWGLNIIKRTNKPRVPKDLIGRMMGMMLPGSSLGLGLSKINFGGLGAKLMRYRMKQKKVDSLESMLQQAIDGGVQLIACQMSMDVMGVDARELIDGVTVGGVATYLAETELANLNLFI